MRAVKSGVTFDESVRYGIHFELIDLDREYKKHSYIGY